MEREERGEKGGGRKEREEGKEGENIHVVMIGRGWREKKEHT